MSKSAIDDIIAEAMDSIVLDHMAKLNTAHLSSSSLPSHLDSRFAKLKSFPSFSSHSNPKAPILTPTFTSSKSLPTGKENTAPVPVPVPVEVPVPAPVELDDHDQDQDQDKTLPFQMETKSPQKPSLDSSHFNGSTGVSPSLSPRNRDPPSPTHQQGCCFPFSPKKITTIITTPKSTGKDRNPKERSTDELDLDNVNEWGDMNKKMVGEIKEQQRKLKKALKEQEKVSKEAAKMVRLVKHSSARMTRTIHDDLFSDDDEF